MRRKPLVLFLVCLSSTFVTGCATARSAGCGKSCTTMGGKGCCSDVSAWAKFGRSMKLAPRETVCADEILANKEKFAGKLVRVCGKVESVCARKGCWVRLGCGKETETLFVKFTCPVRGRLVPMEAVGHTAVVEGTLAISEISEAEARHYKEDEGASADEIAKIIGPQKMAQLNAPAAVVEGVKN